MNLAKIGLRHVHQVCSAWNAIRLTTDSLIQQMKDGMASNRLHFAKRIVWRASVKTHRTVLRLHVLVHDERVPHYRPYQSEEPLSIEIFKEGEMVFTRPNEEHACLFTEDTLLIVVSRNPRADQETYENDVVRMELIDPKSVQL